MSINSSSLQVNALNITGGTSIDQATSNLNTNLTSSINNVTNNITSLYLSSQNYVIPSVQVNNYTVNNVNTLNLSESGYILNIPSNGVSWSSDGQASVLLTCSENNLDLTPLIQNNIYNNDAGLLALADYGPLYSYFSPSTLLTYDFQLRDSPHFTACNTATNTNLNTYKYSTPANSFGVEQMGMMGQGIYGIWFQYAFATAFIATSIIISVADYTQSPNIIFIFGTNDSTFTSGWSFLGGASYTFTALSLINNYTITYPGSYSYYRVVMVSADATQFSISGLKFATNSSVAGAVSVGTIATSSVNIGNTTNSTFMTGQVLTMNTNNTLNINAPSINFNPISGYSPLISGLPIQHNIVLDLSRSETANLAVSASPIYTWYNYRTQFTLLQLFISVATPPTGGNIIITANIYNSSLTYPFTYNNLVGTYTISLSNNGSTYYNTGYSSIISTTNFNPSNILLNAATANGPGGYIKFYVSQVGTTTPGAGLKVTIFGQTTEQN